MIISCLTSYLRLFTLNIAGRCNFPVKKGGLKSTLFTNQIYYLKMCYNLNMIGDQIHRSIFGNRLLATMHKYPGVWKTRKQWAQLSGVPDYKLFNLLRKFVDCDLVDQMRSHPAIFYCFKPNARADYVPESWRYRNPNDEFKTPEPEWSYLIQERGWRGKII